MSDRSDLGEWLNEVTLEAAANTSALALGGGGFNLDRLHPGADLHKWEPDAVLAMALLNYAAAVRRLGPANVLLGVSLVIPLIEVDTVTTSTPDWTDLDLHEFQVPSLYLIQRNVLGRAFDDFEGYRCPVAPPKSLAMPTAETGAYYYCYRDPLARQQGWPYLRVMWIEHYGSVPD